MSENGDTLEIAIAAEVGDYRIPNIPQKENWLLFWVHRKAGTKTL